MSSHLSQSHNFHIAHHPPPNDPNPRPPNATNPSTKIPHQIPLNLSLSTIPSRKHPLSLSLSLSLSLQTIDFSTVKSPQEKKQLCLSHKTLFQFHQYKFDVSFCKNRHSPLSKQLNISLAISAIPIWCRFFCKIDTDSSQNNWKNKYMKEEGENKKMQSDDYLGLKGAEKMSCRRKTLTRIFKINQRSIFAKLT